MIKKKKEKKERWDMDNSGKHITVCRKQLMHVNRRNGFNQIEV